MQMGIELFDEAVLEFKKCLCDEDHAVDALLEIGSCHNMMGSAEEAAVELERIFDDFYTTKAEGTGLGLSNVRRLVADCGATISVASAVGRGSVFTVRFPAQDEPDPEPEDHTGDS